ncbi:tubulin folding cofactor C [Alternaria rosae]|uniref:tubulin folding cofactor C n=1 Tax=Alternaria rosae TaxID=1187941 RepID=UPI001E8CBB91|nr:tubulin folding cofactor C [Alternaria rosae]KAH6873099.1 tubulin folding cofactor C [Alternaria rosae]
MAESNLKETFYRQFNQDVATLRTQIENLSSVSTSGGERNEAIDNCLAGINRVALDVQDASSYLPAYDQRTYSETIKRLSEKLSDVRNSFDPPKKFSFKNRRKDVAKPDAAPNTSSAKPSSVSEQTLSSQQQQQHDTTQHDSSPSALSWKSHARITLPSSPHETSSPTVSHLTHCIVDLSAPTKANAPFAALYLRSISSSLIITGQVAGAIHITDVSNSTIVTACRQFRMHGSKNVDVYLHSASRPIFEDCEGLRFAPLPGVYTTPEIEQSQNQWDQIDDFKWLKAEPSPHFNLLPEAERISEDAWNEKLPGGENESPDDTLKAFDVR